TMRPLASQRAPTSVLIWTSSSCKPSGVWTHCPTFATTAWRSFAWRPRSVTTCLTWQRATTSSVCHATSRNS
ncbi:unnamed protein product, partial [Symbiodinium pilosum]